MTHLKNKNCIALQVFMQTKSTEICSVMLKMFSVVSVSIKFYLKSAVNLQFAIQYLSIWSDKQDYQAAGFSV